MAPNETTILTTNLLQPSQLPEILSLQAFTALFPRSQQSSPQVRALYRDLQQQRRRDADEVAANIEHEAEAAPALRRNILKARGAAGRENPDEEIEIERAVSAHSSFRLACLDAEIVHSSTHQRETQGTSYSPSFQS